MGFILHGNGMYMMMACMHMFSLLTVTACGGTGAGHLVFMAQDGDSVLDGIRLGIRHGITADGILLGTQVIGAVTGVDTGDRDGITIIHTTDGIAGGIVQDILITGLEDISQVLVAQLLLQGHRIPDVHNHHLP